MLGQHYHVVVWAADGKTAEGYSGVTYVDIIVDSVDEAVPRAQRLVPGKVFYHINNIIEHHGHEDR